MFVTVGIGMVGDGLPDGMELEFPFPIFIVDPVCSEERICAPSLPPVILISENPMFAIPSFFALNLNVTREPRDLCAVFLLEAALSNTYVPEICDFLAMVFLIRDFSSIIPTSSRSWLGYIIENFTDEIAFARASIEI